MVCRTWRGLLVRLCLAVLVVECASTRLLAEGATGTRATLVDPAQAVQAGRRLEDDRRWSDAIEHYEAAAERWPENEKLSYGLRRAKVQFSVERRYHDQSFLSQLLPLSQSDAMSFLSDVLQKVRRHYVDEITSTTLIAHGAESLYHALHNESFVQRNLAKPDARAIERVRKQLVAQYWNRPVVESQVRSVIAEVCNLCQAELGLAPGAVVMEYVFGGCNALDDYSSYLTPGRLDDLYSNIEGEFVGIGIEMKAEPGKGLYLINVLPESPAEEGGAQPGDFIVKIDGVACTESSTEEGATMLQGTPGSRVVVELSRGDETAPVSATLTRRAVKVRSIPVVKLIDKANGVGYIRMTGFQKTSADELDAALATLRSQGMKALVWDLRGNPGGLLTASVEVLDRFIDDGVLVSTKGRTEDQNWSYSAQLGPGQWKMPLVVLIDGDSASASEIVAGAIRDHQRGKLIGRKTYGKWSVQSILQARGNAGLRLTTAKFYSPSGQNYSKKGVQPDIEVAATGERKANRRSTNTEGLLEDADVAAGIQVLRQQIARNN